METLPIDSDLKSSVFKYIKDTKLFDCAVCSSCLVEKFADTVVRVNAAKEWIISGSEDLPLDRYILTVFDFHYAEMRLKIVKSLVEILLLDIIQNHTVNISYYSRRDYSEATVKAQEYMVSDVSKLKIFIKNLKKSVSEVIDKNLFRLYSRLSKIDYSTFPVIHENTPDDILLLDEMSGLKKISTTIRMILDDVLLYLETFFEESKSFAVTGFERPANFPVLAESEETI